MHAAFFCSFVCFYLTVASTDILPNKSTNEQHNLTKTTGIDHSQIPCTVLTDKTNEMTQLNSSVFSH